MAPLRDNYQRFGQRVQFDSRRSGVGDVVPTTIEKKGCSSLNVDIAGRDRLGRCGYGFAFAHRQNPSGGVSGAGLVRSTQGWSLDHRTPCLRIVSLRARLHSRRVGFHGLSLGRSGWRAGSGLRNGRGLGTIPSGRSSGVGRLGWYPSGRTDGGSFVAVVLGLGSSREAPGLVALEWLVLGRTLSPYPG